MLKIFAERFGRLESPVYTDERMITYHPFEWSQQSYDRKPQSVFDQDLCESIRFAEYLIKDGRGPVEIWECDVRPCPHETYPCMRPGEIACTSIRPVRRVFYSSP